jgi:hypothetical protein
VSGVQVLIAVEKEPIFQRVGSCHHYFKRYRSSSLLGTPVCRLNHVKASCFLILKQITNFGTPLPAISTALFVLTYLPSPAAITEFPVRPLDIQVILTTVVIFLFVSPSNVRAVANILITRVQLFLASRVYLRASLRLEDKFRLPNSLVSINTVDHTWYAPVIIVSSIFM